MCCCGVKIPKGVYKHKATPRHMTLPSYITYSVNTDHRASMQSTMSRISDEPRKHDGFEVKGIVLLFLCGLYALGLFIVAKLLSYMFSKITAPVKSVFFSTSKTEVKPTRKPSVEINNNTKLEALRRTPTRSFNHG